MDWDPPDAWTTLADSLRALSTQVAVRPKAILVISAHWEAAAFTVTGHPQPPLLYDYYGFPPHTYELTYPAPGAPALAKTVAGLLRAAGLPAAIDNERGYDHGVFVPLKLAYPGADIPVIQLSLHASLDAGLHLRAGQALAPLREQGVLIIGSGYSYHNMRGYGGAGQRAAAQFDAWLSYTVCNQTSTMRAQQLAQWEQAPSARASHPREEHLIPLMVAAGSASEETGTRFFGGPVFGITTSAYRFGDIVST